MSKEYTDQTLMPFGKFKGVKLANVPAQYLMYLHENDLKPGPLRRYIDDNIEVIEHEAKKAEERRAYMRTMYNK